MQQKENKMMVRQCGYIRKKSFQAYLSAGVQGRRRRHHCVWHSHNQVRKMWPWWDSLDWVGGKLVAQLENLSEGHCQKGRWWQIWTWACWFCFSLGFEGGTRLCYLMCSWEGLEHNRGQIYNSKGWEKQSGTSPWSEFQCSCWWVKAAGAGSQWSQGSHPGCAGSQENQQPGGFCASLQHHWGLETVQRELLKKKQEVAGM